MANWLKAFLFSILLAIPNQLVSQIAVGAWRDHLPYVNATGIVIAGDKIFCSTPYALFYYNTKDFSINKLSRSNGLSDVGISAINFDQLSKILIVAYENANLDLISGTNVFNLNHIKNKQIQGNKRINHIFFNERLAYLSCGFGIVVLDLDKKEIKETWYIGPNASAIEIHGLAIDETYIYAASSTGILRADKNNPNLIDYSQWEKIGSLPFPNASYKHIISYNSDIFATLHNTNDNTSTLYRKNGENWQEFFSPGKLITSLKTFNNLLYVADEKAVSIYNNSLNLENKITSYGFAGTEPNDLLATTTGKIFIADKLFGLVEQTGSSVYEYYIPNGPFNNHVWDIDAQANQVWAAGGGHQTSGENFGNIGELFIFQNESWNSKILWSSNARDFSKIMINPYNPSQVFAGAWGAGVYLFENGELTANYNEQNSSLQSIFPGQDYIRIGGMTMDEQQNLYVSNAGVSNPVSVKTASGQWFSFNFPELSGFGDLAEIINTQSGNKWVQLAKGGGLFVFNDNYTPSNTNDDLHKRFSIYDETGQFATNEVFSIAEDEDGVIWVGTDMGVFTYYNPQEVFNESLFYASRVKVADKDNDGYVQYLLHKEKITAIAIDGANRKWFGTESSGVFLMSESGEQEIFHFTTENSKLLSNNILSIAIEPKSGEVFFGTDLGICSFKSTATKGDISYSGAYVYPNPVRENYNGLITITGLAPNVDVKITDVAGQLVYQTRAFGGQAIWNGKNFSGNRVSTGVYLIFCTDEKGQAAKVLKLLFIN